MPSLFHDAASVAALLIITQAMIAEAPKKGEAGGGGRHGFLSPLCFKQVSEYKTPGSDAGGFVGIELRSLQR
ncbi:MAG: hypothetical protein K2Y19_20745 [Afipia birgiae]|nr:hypothetical protein [Afipia birgiae]